MKKDLKLKRLLAVTLCLCLLLSTGVYGTDYSASAEADEPQDSVVEHDHDGWTAWRGETTTLESGNYYLAKDLGLNGEAYYIDGDVTLCLNGHTITSGNSFFRVEEDATLTLTDCKNSGMMTGGKSSSVYVNGGTFIMENGTIFGNTVWTYNGVVAGGTVYVNGGEFIMKGGTISGNTSKSHGGGVYVNGGEFTMKGGTISGNTATNYGGGIYMTGGSTFTMESGEISGNTASVYNGGGIYMTGDSTFNMESGTISGNKSQYYGGGVYMAGGSTFNMENGVISDNIASKESGGGVYIYGDCTFTMKDSEISGNTAGSIGGGVYVYYNSIFTMNSGTISDNMSGAIGGGVYVYANSTFTMNSGKISGNTAETNGGGVYLLSNSTFTMDSGEISDNTAKNNGGGVFVNGSTFTMENGEISDNTATGDGGGVYVYSNSTFAMDGGKISDNDARDGSGVCVKSSDFTMENSTISENTAKNNGGGVYIISGIITVQNGTISGNTAVADGGGVFVYDTMIVSGTTVVADNTLSDKTTQNNITLVLEATDILVAGELTDDARIGVHRLSDVKEKPVLTREYGDHHSDDAGKYFFYDNAESLDNCDVGTGPDGEAWFGYNVTFADRNAHTLEEQFVGYNCTATPIDDNHWSTEIGGVKFDFDTPITANLTLYSDLGTILTPMTSQIRFRRNADGSYANKFDIRSRAKITNDDFTKYIAETNEDAVKKITKVGFVYTRNSTDFSIADAQKVAKGETVSGYVDASVNYIQDADGYYMFTCIIKDIPVKDVEQDVTAYAYICVEDKWHFYNAETTIFFKEIYDRCYPQAAAEYGW